MPNKKLKENKILFKALEMKIRLTQ